MQDVHHPQKVYLAFQGGGARGIAHVGAISAVEELPINVVGVAGTSAGAIVAALYAAGYRASDLFDSEGESHILKSLRGGIWSRPIDLFGPGGWAKILGMRRVALQVGKWTQLLSGLAPRAILAFLSLISLYYWPRCLLVVLVAFFVTVAIKLRRIYSGLAPLTTVRKVVDAALADRLGLKGEVTFAALVQKGCIPLKLVATNLTKKDLELFSAETTPHVVVADAVAASIRLPFIFRPWELQIKRSIGICSFFSSNSFLDGGLISNLPVWAFDEERALYPDAVTVAFALASDPVVDEEKGSRPHWVRSAIDAVISGPAQIHLRGVDRLVYVPLPSRLGVLDFDASFNDCKQVVAEAKNQSLTVLNSELIDIPNLMRASLDEFRNYVWNEAHKHFATLFAHSPDILAPRVAIAVQRPTALQSMTIAYEAGHNQSLRGTAISFSHDTLGDAWKERGSDDIWFNTFEDGEEADLYATSKWRSAVPIQIELAKTDGPSANLAAIAIIDQPYPNSLSLADSDALSAFALTVHNAALEWIKSADFGRLVRRSTSWL